MLCIILQYIMVQNDVFWLKHLKILRKFHPQPSPAVHREIMHTEPCTGQDEIDDITVFYKIFIIVVWKKKLFYARERTCMHLFTTRNVTREWATGQCFMRFNLCLKCVFEAIWVKYFAEFEKEIYWKNLQIGVQKQEHFKKIEPKFKICTFVDGFSNYLITFALTWCKIWFSALLFHI